VHDKETKSVLIASELNEEFSFGSFRCVMNANVPDSIGCVYVSLSADQSAIISVASTDGIVSWSESFGPVVLLMREVLSQREMSLETPYARNIWKKAFELGEIQTSYTNASTDDEAAEVVMELCVQHNCLGVLERCKQKKKESHFL
jgi:hypothetical protein